MNACSLLTESMISDARDATRRTDTTLMQALAKIYAGDEAGLVSELARCFAMRCLDAASLLAVTPSFDRLPLAVAMRRLCLVAQDAEHLIVVLADPFDSDIRTWLTAQAGSEPEFCLASQADIKAYLVRQEATTRTMDSIVAEPTKSSSGAASEVLSFEAINEAVSPAVKLVTSTLYDALKAGASDVHFESIATGLAIKYRIDGVLDLVRVIAGRELAEQAVSRIKVLAELDIAERRLPQDGSFSVQSGGRDIDLRVSVMPSVHAEDAVVRILDKRAMVESGGALSLSALGFDGHSLAQLRRLATQPYGMMLVTGPTGSGKTTTLYAALSEAHTGRDKIITIEDPVEYQIPGILQIPVNDKKGLTFARGLRSILRHDPDKIMVGEFRDRETAEIAVQSALTGHLVMTTVHANDVFDVFGRFSHMGIDMYALASALNGVSAQRLLRNNCPHCVQPLADDTQSRKFDPACGSFDLRAGSGCIACRGTGFKGRTAIAEILVLNDEIRELLIARAPIRHIKEAAVRQGTQSLRDAALDLVRRGVTTMEEVQRVILVA